MWARLLLTHTNISHSRVRILSTATGFKTNISTTTVGIRSYRGTANTGKHRYTHIHTRTHARTDTRTQTHARMHAS